MNKYMKTMQLIKNLGFDENSVDSNDSFVRHTMKFWKIHFLSLDDIAYFWLLNKKNRVNDSFIRIEDRNMASVLKKYGNIEIKWGDNNEAEIIYPINLKYSRIHKMLHLKGFFMMEKELMIT